MTYEQFSRAASEAYVCKDAVNGTPPPANDVPPVNPIGDDITFQLLDMRHDVPGPNGMPEFMLLGRATMCGGLGRAEQVVVLIFTTGGRGGMGPPVRANMFPFADINGFAATGTAPFAIPPQGLDNAWTCWIA